MTDFNPINNRNIFQSTFSQNVQNNPVPNEGANIKNNTMPAPQIFQETVAKPLMYNLEMAKMDNETILKYLKSLLQLPNSIDKFVEQINSKTPDSKFIKMFVQNLLNTKELADFLNSNSKIASEKILKAISNSLKSGAYDTSDLREIFSILTSFSSQTNVTSNALKEFLLLYIPLNPLVFDKPFEIAAKNASEEESIKNSELSVMFETINFSNVLCSLNAENNNAYIDLFAPFDFPFERFKNIIEELLKNANMNAYIEFHPRKGQDEKKENGIQNFKIVSKNLISSNVLVAAHLIIKIIFKIDNDFT